MLYIGSLHRVTGASVRTKPLSTPSAGDVGPAAGTERRTRLRGPRGRESGGRGQGRGGAWLREVPPPSPVARRRPATKQNGVGSASGAGSLKEPRTRGRGGREAGGGRGPRGGGRQVADGGGSRGPPPSRGGLREAVGGHPARPRPGERRSGVTMSTQVSTAAARGDRPQRAPRPSRRPPRSRPPRRGLGERRCPGLAVLSAAGRGVAGAQRPARGWLAAPGPLGLPSACTARRSPRSRPLEHGRFVGVFVARTHFFLCKI